MSFDDDLDGERHSARFTRLVDGKEVGFEAYSEIWRNMGRHVVISAPSMDELASAWTQIVGTDLDRERAQHVRIVRAK